jgi:pilus assembly protein CpaB
VLGLLAALFAAVLVAALTTGPQGVPSLSLSNAPTQVVVAEKALTAGHVIASDDVRLQKVTSVDVSPGSIQSIAPLIGRVLIREMAEGQQLTAGSIAGLGTGPEIEAMLDQGFRAATITLSDRGPAQFVYPGGIVDVIAIFDIPRGYPGEGETVSRTVLDGIRVLAVEGFSDAAAQAEAKDELKGALRSGRGPTLTLLVTPDEAQVLQLARSLGTLSVTLRPTEETDLGSGKTISMEKLLSLENSRRDGRTNGASVMVRKDNGEIVIPIKRSRASEEASKTADSDEEAEAPRRRWSTTVIRDGKRSTYTFEESD